MEKSQVGTAFVSAMNCYHASDIRSAIHACREILHVDPTNPDALALHDRCVKASEANEIGTLLRRFDDVVDLLMSGKSEVDRFIAGNYLHFHDHHFHPHYKEWRVRRLRKLIEIYGSDFSGKRILELGGGIGDIGGFLAELGGEVLALEARPANRAFAKLRLRHLKNYESIECNLEEDFRHLGRFDLIVNFGLIEVIENVENVLRCCAAMSDEIVLETIVSDSTDPNYRLPHDLSSDGPDNPIGGKAVRVSPALIETFFANEGFHARRFFTRDLSTLDHIYHWTHRNDGSAPNRLRRFWTFSKRPEEAGGAAS